jgi:hypothetical protein
MSAKRLVVVPGIVGPTSRRAFLRYGGGVVGASLLVPYWLRNAVAQSVASFDFYISPTGNDSNPGSQASPWALTSLLNPRVTTAHNSTIQANQAKMAGKRIGVLPGTYSLQSYVSSGFALDWQEPVLIVPSGTSASAMTLLQSTQPLGAIIDFGLTDTNNGGANGMPGIGTSGNSLSQWVIIDGFELRNANTSLMRVGGGSLAGQIIVRNNYVHHSYSTSNGGNSAGIVVYNCSGPLVQNNYITDIVNTYGRNSGVECWFSNNHVLEYNTIVMSNSGAGAIYIKNASQHDATIRYNYCDLSAAPSYGGSGACAWDLSGTSSSTSVFHHNIVLANFCMGTNIAGVNTVSIAENQRFYNNTFVGTNNFGGLQTFGSGAYLTHYNNIYSDSTAGGRGAVDTNTTAPTLTDYNLYPPTVSLGLTSSGSTDYPTLYSSTAAWAAALPSACTGKDAHSVIGAPTFVGGTPALPAHKYQLASGSLGKGTGRSNGQTSGTALDMGAWGGTDATTGQPIAQIGCNFTPGSPIAIPMAPALTVS